ncbi:MAG: hypothetical protein JRF29_06380 [Deltaproteobacteria bacterium]|jgi:hypothetical protein|nr:hypothetical protein [Deltaproteobacteria bacterium]
MIRNLSAGLVIVFLFFGCASDPQPKPDFQDGTRVGVFNSLEPYLTHRHMTIDRVNSFKQQIDVDWDIPTYLNTRLANDLKKDRRFVVVPIQAPQVQSRLQQLSAQIGVAATSRRIPQELIDFIDNQAKVHDLDVVIIVQSFRGNSRWKINDDPIVLEGYGLFTRRTMLGAFGIRNSWVHPYAQIRLVVLTTQPVVRIGAGSPTMTRARMDNFNWPADIRNIPESELNKIRPRIKAYADQAVKNALTSANMVTAE